MMRLMMSGVALAVAAICALPVLAEEKPMSVLDFEVNTIDGDPVKLAEKYDGKVLLVVNVASKCGLTKQYEQLVALHEKYKEKGFEILGFPANNFMGQEPGTNDEIKTFCTTKYDVEFDMFSKISVKGDDKAPLYMFLTEETTNPDFAGEIQWNFEKFLVGRDGKVIARFDPRTKPDDEKVIAAIEAALEQEDAEA
jgi:glutathione peroxidase